MEQKPFSPSCERNKDVILDVLKKIILPTHSKLLEVGSGTGQHAVCMAPHFPHIKWVTSDIRTNHKGMKMWLSEFPSSNILGPHSFKVGTDPVPNGDFDLVFTANTLHIMGWKEVKTLIKQLGKILKKDALILIYGPFNYNGAFTSESNEKFQHWLQEQDPKSSIRNFEDIERTMSAVNIQLQQDIEMPSNNRILVFKKY